VPKAKAKAKAKAKTKAKTKAKEDLVSSPAHYAATKGLEPINIIETFDLPFHLACAVRYICRFRHKGGSLDLLKAMWYISRYLYRYYEMDPDEILDMDISKILDNLTEPPMSATN